jgi:hypothetical protein
MKTPFGVARKFFLRPLAGGCCFYLTYHRGRPQLDKAFGLVENAEGAKHPPRISQRKNQPGSLRRKKKLPGKSRLLCTH